MSYQSPEEQQRAQYGAGQQQQQQQHYPATSHQAQATGSGFDSNHTQTSVERGYTSTGNSGLGEHSNLQQANQGGFREGQQYQATGPDSHQNHGHGHGHADALRSRVDAAGAPHNTLAGVGEGYGAGVAGHHDGSFGKHKAVPEYGRSDEHGGSHGHGILHGQGHGHGDGHGHNESGSHGHNGADHHSGATPAAGGAAAAAGAGAHAHHERGHDGLDRDGQRHEGHSLQTGGGKLGGPPAPPPAGVEGHGGHDHSGHVREGSATSGQHKPSLGDKIIGSIEVSVGKMTHNVDKIEAGQAKKQGLETGRETHGSAAQYNTPNDQRAGYKVTHPDSRQQVDSRQQLDEASKGQAGFGGVSDSARH